MEDQRLAEPSTDQQHATYCIISFQGERLPESFKPLILSKWMRSLKFGNDYFRLCDNSSYFKNYERYIRSILSGVSTTTSLAVLTEDRDVVLGFSVVREDVLHYVHVHRDQRRLGIGQSLLPKEFNKTTHLTKTALMLWPKYPNVIFDPFA